LCFGQDIKKGMAKQQACEQIADQGRQFQSLGDLSAKEAT